MDERQIRNRMEQARREPPAWKWKLLRAIDDLAGRPGAMDVFRGHIRTVAAELAADFERRQTLPRGESMSVAEYEEKREPKNLLSPGRRLTVAEMFFILAAFHDGMRWALRMSPIAPEEWEEEDVARLVDFQGKKAGKKVEFFRTPDYAVFCMYRSHADQCADLPDGDERAADVLQGYVCKVGVALGLLLAEPASPARAAQSPATAQTPLPEQAQAQAKPDDLITCEVAIADYQTSRRTIQRRLKDGKLKDHRPPDSPKNATYQLSRAELGQLFPRKK